MADVLPFDNDQDAYYFRIYQDDVARELAGVIESSPWRYTMLQAAQSESFVLRSLVALGALHCSVKLSHLAENSTASVKESNMAVSKLHRDFAVRAYGKAIAAMRKIMTDDQDANVTIRNALLASLLIFAIELFMGSPCAAIIQSQVGYAVLRQLETDKPHRKLGLESPNELVVDNDIYHEFGRIDLLYAQRWGEHILGLHRTRRQDGEEAIRNMPEYFGSLDEARVYHELLLRRTFHLIGETYARIMASRKGKLRTIYVDAPGKLVDPCYIPQELLAARKAYRENLQHWRCAFQPIFPGLLASKKPITAIGGALLKAQALYAEIALAAAFITNECDFDIYLPAFREIVSLFELISTGADFVYPRGIPTFDMSPKFENPLYGVATYCRDRDTRYRALVILREMSTRDATKDTTRRWTRAAYVVAIEENNRILYGDKLPEEARWRLVWSLNHVQDEERHLTLICARRRIYPGGRDYPARREFRWQLFERKEVEAMKEVEDIPRRQWNFGRIETSQSLIYKPLAIKWEEVFEELLTVRPQQDVEDTAVLDHSFTIPVWMLANQ